MEEHEDIPLSVHKLAEQSMMHIAELAQRAGDDVAGQAVVKAYVRRVRGVFEEGRME